LRRFPPICRIQRKHWSHVGWLARTLGAMAFCAYRTSKERNSEIEFMIRDDDWRFRHLMLDLNDVEGLFTE
jgi:hypothetical protein